MPIDIARWKTSVNTVWTGVWINVLGALLLTAVMMLDAEIPVNPIVQVLARLSNLIVYAGMIVQVVGMFKLRGAVDAEDVKAVTLLAVGTGLSLLVLFFETLSDTAVNILKFVIGLAVLVMVLMGVYKLKTSLTFPFKAAKGAGMLFAGLIIALAGGFLAGFIADLTPTAADIILSLALLAAAVLYIAGWYKIKTADPDDYLAKYPSAQEQDEQE